MEKNRRAEILLITPPHYYFANSLAGPRLLSSLQDKGYEADHWDLDHKLYGYLFSKPFLSRCLKRINDKHKHFSSVEIRELIKSFPYAQQHLHDNGIVCVNEGDSDKFFEYITSCVSKISESQSILDCRFLSLNKKDFVSNFGRVELGALIVSLAYYPTRLDLLEGMAMRFSPHREKDICNATAAAAENYLVEFYKENIIPKITELNPEIVGISINYFSQFIPAFTLARMLKEYKSELYIVLGGATLTTTSKSFTKRIALWDWFDSIITSYGEKTLPLLVNVVTNNSSFEKVPNLIYRSNSGHIKTTSPADTLQPQEIPLPCFSDNRPRPILNLQTSFGCDYGRCAFCHYPYANECQGISRKPLYQVKAVGKVVDDMEGLIERHNPRMIFLVDSNIPARRLGAIADEIIKRKFDVKYFSFMRAEKYFTSVEFCQKIRQSGYVAGFMGLEAASERVNVLMRKDVDLEQVEKIMKVFLQTDIILNIFCIIGFPSETKEEAFQTRDFIKKNLHLLKGEISIAPFRLGVDTYIHHHLDEYGVTIIPRQPKEEFSTDFNYQVKEGLSQRETEELVKQFYQELNIKYFSGKAFIEILGKK